MERKETLEKGKKEGTFSYFEEFFLVRAEGDERVFFQKDEDLKRQLFSLKRKLYGQEGPGALSFSEEKLGLGIEDFSSVGELEDRLARLLIPFREELKNEGLSLLPRGVDPWTPFPWPLSSAPEAEEREKRIREWTGGLYFGLPSGFEEDRRRRIALARVLSPIFAAVFDNAGLFEGRPSSCFVLRQELLRKEKSLSTESIEKEGKIFITSLDALPLSYGLGAAALLMGLFQSEENGRVLEKRLLPENSDNIRRGKDSARDHGIRGYYLSDYFVNWGMDLLALAQKGLKKEDQVYLVPLQNLWSNLDAPRDQTDPPAFDPQP